MKTANTFWKIIFILLTVSNSGQSRESENKDNLWASPFLHSGIPFYQSTQQREFNPKYFSLAILAKVYHKEAVSYSTRDGKRFKGNRLPLPENGTIRVLFLGMMSTLVHAEAIFNFILHPLKVMDLINEWFNQYQL